MKKATKMFLIEQGTFEIRFRVYPSAHRYNVYAFDGTVGEAMEKLCRTMDEMLHNSMLLRARRLGNTVLNANLVYIGDSADKRKNHHLLRFRCTFPQDQPKWELLYYMGSFKDRFNAIRKRMPAEQQSASDPATSTTESTEAEKQQLIDPQALNSCKCGARPVVEMCKDLINIKCPSCGQVVTGADAETVMNIWQAKNFKCIAITNTPPWQTDIVRMCDEVKRLLLEKNRKYGDSALRPKRIFSKADPIEQLKVRIDDKISRVQSGQVDDDEDVYMDLTGYLILLMVAMERQRRSNEQSEEVDHSRQ